MCGAGYKEWTIRSEFGQERTLLDEAAQMIRANNQNGPRLEDMLTALAEGCLNAIEHGNKQNISKQVKVTLTSSETTYKIRIYDQGKGTLMVMQELYAPQIVHNNWKRKSPRGWGLLLIRSLADHVESGYEKETGLFYIEMQFTKVGDKHE